MYAAEIFRDTPKYATIEGNRPDANDIGHFPGLVNDHTVNKRCVNCHKAGIRKRSCYQCEGCLGKPGLCVVPCLREHHR